MNIAQPLRRGDLRDALVAYARRATDAGCVNAMSLRAAARDLGVSSGAVYRHFDDKDALLKAVAHQGFAEMTAMFLTIRPEDAIADTARIAVARAFRMGRAYMRFAHDNPTLWRMMFGRIGMLCRDDHTRDPEAMRYTILDAVRENSRDLYRLGSLPQEPEIDDIRFMWSAIHGAADLAQSGARQDGGALMEVADQTTARSLRALGCAPGLIEGGRAILDDEG